MKTLINYDKINILTLAKENYMNTNIFNSTDLIAKVKSPIAIFGIALITVSLFFALGSSLFTQCYQVKSDNGVITCYSYNFITGIRTNNVPCTSSCIPVGSSR